MADVYITLAWIFEDPPARARDYIRYALGQAKLRLEQRKAWAASSGADISNEPQTKAEEAWIDSQRWSFITEVNLGTWSSKTTRGMANEAGCLDFYEDVYQSFSSSTHSTWDHVERFNLGTCAEVLHRYHRIPFVAPIRLDVGLARLAAGYLEKTLALFDEKTGVSVATPSPLSIFDTWFGKLADSATDSDSDPETRGSSPGR